VLQSRSLPRPGPPGGGPGFPAGLVPRSDYSRGPLERLVRLKFASPPRLNATSRRASTTIPCLHVPPGAPIRNRVAHAPPATARRERRVISAGRPQVCRALGRSRRLDLVEELTHAFIPRGG
jgi:hypothetical protein